MIFMGQKMQEQYKELGWKIIPICPDKKKPIGLWRKIPVDMTKYPNASVAIVGDESGMVIIDIDPKGAVAWEALEYAHGVPNTLTSKTKRGKHFYFKAKPGQKYRGKIPRYEGIDIKHAGYALEAPSPGYEWLNWGTEVAEVPTWLAPLIERNPPTGKVRGEIQVRDEAVRPVIEFLKTVELDYTDWITTGQALHAAYNGDDEGLEAWIELSRGKSFEEGDDEVCVEKWRTFTSDGGISLGSLFHVAKSKGFIGQLTLKGDKIAFAKSQSERYQRELEVDWFSESGRRITVHPSQALKLFHDEGYAMYQPTGKVIRLAEEHGVRAAKFIDVNALKSVYAPYALKIYDDEGNAKYKDALDVWLKHEERKLYTRIAFSPKHISGALNLWGDIPCRAEAGDCTPLLDFILEIICRGNVDKYNYLIKWLAQLMQKREVKSTIVPVIIGVQGAGKGLLTDGILKSILGQYYLLIDKSDTIIERFNDEQANKFLTVLDEATWGRNYALSNLLKRLTGSETMQVEEKFGSRYTIENYSRYIVTSNDIDSVRIEPGNRRFLVFECAEPREISYYSRLWDMVREGSAVRALYAHLLKVDVSDWHPQLFPHELDTEGEGTKVSSLGPVAKFLYELAFESPAQIWRVKGGRWYVGSTELFNCFKLRADRMEAGRYTQSRFAAEVKKFIPKLDGMKTRTNTATHYTMSPHVLRELINARMRIGATCDLKDEEYLIHGEQLDYNAWDF